MNVIFIKGSLASLWDDNLFFRYLWEEARDLTDLYTITILIIKFKNVFRAHRHIGVQRVEFLENGGNTLNINFYPPLCDAERGIKGVSSWDNPGLEVDFILG